MSGSTTIAARARSPMSALSASPWRATWSSIISAAAGPAQRRASWREDDRLPAAARRGGARLPPARRHPGAALQGDAAAAPRSVPAPPARRRSPLPPIATDLDLSLAAVEKHCSRALADLRAALERRGLPAGDGPMSRRAALRRRRATGRCATMTAALGRRRPPPPPMFRRRSRIRPWPKRWSQLPAFGRLGWRHSARCAPPAAAATRHRSARSRWSARSASAAGRAAGIRPAPAPTIAALRDAARPAARRSQLADGSTTPSERRDQPRRDAATSANARSTMQQRPGLFRCRARTRAARSPSMPEVGDASARHRVRHRYRARRAFSSQSIAARCASAAHPVRDKAAVIVPAGWRSRFSAGGQARAPDRFDATQQDWRQDWLDTDDMRLGELVDALNRRGGLDGDRSAAADRWPGSRSGRFRA